MVTLPQHIELLKERLLDPSGSNPLLHFRFKREPSFIFNDTQLKLLLEALARHNFLLIRKESTAKHTSLLHALELDATAFDRIETLFEIQERSHRNHGLLTLKLALGLLDYKHNHKTWQAPILLLNATLIKKDATRYALQFDGEFHVNPVLEFKLKQDGIHLPGFKPGSSPDEYFELLQPLAKENDWKIDQIGFLANLSWHRLAAYRFIESQGDLLDQNGPLVAIFNGEKKVHKSKRPRSFFLSMNTPQRTALEFGYRGENTRIVGVPGSGKTRILSNMAIQALAVPQKVLYIAPHVRTLKKVQETINEAHLGNFTLLLDRSNLGKMTLINNLLESAENKSRTSFWPHLKTYQGDDQSKYDEYIQKMALADGYIRETLTSLNSQRWYTSAQEFDQFFKNFFDLKDYRIEELKNLPLELLPDKVTPLADLLIDKREELLDRPDDHIVDLYQSRNELDRAELEDLISCGELKKKTDYITGKLDRKTAITYLEEILPLQLPFVPNPITLFNAISTFRTRWRLKEERTDKYVKLVGLLRKEFGPKDVPEIKNEYLEKQKSWLPGISQINSSSSDNLNPSLNKDIQGAEWENLLKVLEYELKKRRLEEEILALFDQDILELDINLIEQYQNHPLFQKDGLKGLLETIQSASGMEYERLEKLESEELADFFSCIKEANALRKRIARADLEEHEALRNSLLQVFKEAYWHQILLNPRAVRLEENREWRVNPYEVMSDSQIQEHLQKLQKLHELEQKLEDNALLKLRKLVSQIEQTAQKKLDYQTLFNIQQEVSDFETSRDVIDFRKWLSLRKKIQSLLRKPTTDLNVSSILKKIRKYNRVLIESEAYYSSLDQKKLADLLLEQKSIQQLEEMQERLKNQKQEALILFYILELEKVLKNLEEISSDSLYGDQGIRPNALVKLQEINQNYFDRSLLDEAELNWLSENLTSLEAQKELLKDLLKLDQWFEEFNQKGISEHTPLSLRNWIKKQNGYEDIVLKIKKDLEEARELGVIIDLIGAENSRILLRALEKSDILQEQDTDLLYKRLIATLSYIAVKHMINRWPDPERLDNLYESIQSPELIGLRPWLLKLNEYYAGCESEQYKKELAWLKAQKERPDRTVGVAQIFENCPTLIQTIKPCILAQPLNAARYLSDPRYHFDLILFDDANQILLEDSIALLLKADQTVIAGDEQMPLPVNPLVHIHEKEIITEPISLFEKAQNLRSVETRLSYRDFRPTLLAFNNENFYGHKMYIDPIYDRSSKRYTDIARYRPTLAPLTIVKDGIYTDEGNLAEAQATIETIKYLRKFSHNDSIGVIVFSARQRRLLRQLLEKEEPFWSRLQESGEFEILSPTSLDGVEKEYVIISFGYGPDEKGKIDFGNLNRRDLFRRINAASSRASESTFVISSIAPDQINAETHPNLEVLKEFLEFAQNPVEFNHETPLNILEQKMQEALAPKTIRKIYPDLPLYILLDEKGNLEKLLIGTFIQGPNFMDYMMIRDILEHIGKEYPNEVQTFDFRPLYGIDEESQDLNNNHEKN